MRIPATIITVAAAGALCAACGSVATPVSTPRTATTAPDRISPVPTGQPTTESASTRTDRSIGGSASRFCIAARKAGMTNLAIIDDTHNKSPNLLLAGIDKLAAIAPAEIKQDFARFAEVEHALLDPNHPKPALLNEATSTNMATRIRHLASYLDKSCAIR